MTRLIDADALVYDEIEPDCLVVFKSDIDRQPTIDAEPIRHGKWVDDAMGVLRCSECKTQAPWRFNNYRWKANYCPQCGARMDEE